MKRPVVLLLCLSLSVLAGHAVTLTSVEPDPAPDTFAGYRVGIDPTTGEFLESVPPIPVDQLPKSLQNSLNTSSEGLVERPSSVPGGGVMVDLRGRFQNTYVATVDANGNVTAACDTEIPNANDEKE